MQYFLAGQNFRLVDQNKYISVGQILKLDDEYASTSRSLAAATRSQWIRRIKESEVEKYQKQWDNSKKKAVEQKKEELKVTTDNGKKIESIKEKLKVKEMKDSDVADEVIDQNKIIDAAAKRKAQQASQITQTAEITVKVEEAVDKSQDIKDAIDKRAREKSKKSKLNLRIGK